MKCEVGNVTPERYAMKPAAARLSPIALSLIIAFGWQTAIALPVGPQVVNGTASISSSANAMNITNTQGAIINWQGFSISAGNQVHFNQPSALSAVLNRVTGGDPSKILGALTSNGKVFLINPNGILFGAGARIDTAGFVASTLNIANEDFLAGKMKFTAGPNAGKLENQGNINVANGGEVWLIAPDVKNTGVITAPNGDILLAAGKEVHLVDSRNPEIALVVRAPENEALNLGTLQADAGRIGMYGGVIRQQGIVSANSAVVDKNGRIFFKATQAAHIESGSTVSANGVNGGDVLLEATEGTATVSGTIAAMGTGGKGGTVQVLGKNSGLLGDAVVDASGQTGGGTVLVGGDYLGSNPEIKNAQFTYTGKDTQIIADATDTGKGGKVIVWADDSTRAYGRIFARGGKNGGDGGFVETSGKRYIDLGLIPPDAGAYQGQAGLWLLDPGNIKIVDGGGSPSATQVTEPGADYFTPNAGNDSYLDTSTLSDTLKTTNVTVKTDTGHITLASAINFSDFRHSGKTLILSTAENIGTGGNINLDNNITTGMNIALNLELAASGKITIKEGVVITLYRSETPPSFSDFGYFKANSKNGFDMKGATIDALGPVEITNTTNGAIDIKGFIGSLGLHSNLKNEAPGGNITMTGNGSFVLMGQDNPTELNILTVSSTGVNTLQNVKAGKLILDTESNGVTYNIGGESASFSIKELEAGLRGNPLQSLTVNTGLMGGASPETLKINGIKAIGNVTLTSPGANTINILAPIESSSGKVTLDVKTPIAATTEIVVKAAELDLKSTGSIGSSTPFRTQVKRLSATSTATIDGGINIDNTANASADTLTTGNITAESGNITLAHSGSDLSIDGTISAQGASTIRLSNDTAGKTITATDSGSLNNPSGVVILSSKGASNLLKHVRADQLLLNAGAAGVAYNIGDTGANIAINSLQAGSAVNPLQSLGVNLAAMSGTLNIDGVVANDWASFFGGNVDFQIRSPIKAANKVEMLGRSIKDGLAFGNAIETSRLELQATQEDIGSGFKSLDAGGNTVVSPSFSPLKTMINQLEAESAQGNINILNKGDLELVDAGVLASQGNITLEAVHASPTGDIAINAPVEAVTAGSIWLAADPDASLTINKPVSSQGGDIYLFSDPTKTLPSTTQVSTDLPGNVYLNGALVGAGTPPPSTPTPSPGTMPSPEQPSGTQELAAKELVTTLDNTENNNPVQLVSLVEASEDEKKPSEEESYLGQESGTTNQGANDGKKYCN